MQKLQLTKKYERYPEYKDSGVEWLGEIPAGWESKKIKHLGRSIIGLTYSPEDVTDETGTLVLRSSNIQNEKLSLLDNVYVRSKIPKELITRKGDILICARNGSRALVGKSILIDENSTGVSFGAFMALYRGKSSKHVSYFLKSEAFYSQLSSTLTSTINQLTNHYLNNVVVSVPPEDAQTKITAYLDEKVSIIDRTIEGKKKLIELLREKRTAVINQAVTKGLDKNAELVESGVDWIGKIPKGWELKKLKSGFNFEKGKESGKFTQEFVGDENNIGEFPVYSGQTENYGILGSINSYKYNFPKGVLFSTTVGAKAMTTKLLTGKFSLSQNCVLMVPNKKSDSAYFNYLLEIGFKRMKDDIPAHMQPSLRVSDLNKFTVLFPKIEEQEKIVAYLDIKISNYDTAIELVKKSIETLQEFKSSLISHVVTGKVRV